MRARARARLKLKIISISKNCQIHQTLHQTLGTLSNFEIGFLMNLSGTGTGTHAGTRNLALIFQIFVLISYALELIGLVELKAIIEYIKSEGQLLPRNGILRSHIACARTRNFHLEILKGQDLYPFSISGHPHR